MPKIKIKSVTYKELLILSKNEYNLATGNAQLKLTARILVNFVRHKLSNYDDVIKAMSAKPYKGLSKDLVYTKWLYLEQIKCQYEELFDECCNQQKYLKK